MPCWPPRSPFNRSNRFPGGTLRSPKLSAACTSSSLRCARRCTSGGNSRERSRRKTFSVSPSAKLRITRFDNNALRYYRNSLPQGAQPNQALQLPAPCCAVIDPWWNLALKLGRFGRSRSAGAAPERPSVGRRTGAEFRRGPTQERERPETSSISRVSSGVPSRPIARRRIGVGATRHEPSGGPP
jgi:hypothetical protein